MQPSASPGSLIQRNASIFASPVSFVLGVPIARPAGSHHSLPSGPLPLRLVSMTACRREMPVAAMICLA